MQTTTERLFIRVAIPVVAMAVVLPALILWPRPPEEAATIASFRTHRAQYDELREMLLADNDLIHVADWGIYTSDSAVPQVPPQGKFPVARFQKYVSLLREIDAKGAFRTHETRPEIGILVWASGFAGDTRHINICWRDDQPINQVASLDEFYRTPKPRKPVYRNIEGDWYMWADW